MRSIRVLAALVAAGSAIPATGQTLDLDIETDRRKRGLSESAGALSASARLGVDPLPGLSLTGEAALLRGSTRHGGADVGLDLAAFYRIDRGLLGVEFGVIGRFFPGANTDLTYGELQAGGFLSLGPATAGASINYAPPQSTIGGDNLHLRLHGDLGLPGTPLTLRSHVGHSSGTMDDPIRAARLRPGGSAWDWSLGADYVRGPLIFGVTYSDTSMARPIPAAPFTDPRHGGAVITARIGYRF